MSDTEDLDGLEIAWGWFIGVIGSVARTLVQIWEWVDTWPLSFKLIGGGAIAALMLIGLAKR